ncbi:MAG: hypothetical protein R2856_22010 [Caldilineaceae bacterium]
MRELSWKSIKPRLMPAFRLWQQWGEPVLPLYRILRTLYSYPGYIKDWRQYRMLPGAESLAVKDAYPVLLERTPITPFDPHYLYQAVWATERIVSATQSRHIDVGSDIRFAAMLASHMPVTFVDIRPLQVDVPGFSSMAGSLFGSLSADGGVESVSCLHVIEHGVGPIRRSVDPGGTRHALCRVAASGGAGRQLVPFDAGRPCATVQRTPHPHAHTDPGNVSGFDAG